MDTMDVSDSSAVERHIKQQKLAIDLLNISNSVYLGCRDDELSQLNEFLNRPVEKQGKSMFVFGLSGTGKTTTVKHAVSEFTSDRKNIRSIYMTGSGYDSIKDFIIDLFDKLLGYPQKKTIKLLKLAQNGKSIEYSKMCLLLTSLFRTVKKVTILLIDEVDYLQHFTIFRGGKRNSNWLLQAIFKASSAKLSNVATIAISNNLELATKLITDNCIRLMFKPYTEQQMVSIVTDKLNTLEDKRSIVNKTALLILARRVANTSGDCRAYLDSFVRALTTSMSNLEKDSQPLTDYEASLSHTPSVDSSRVLVDDVETPNDLDATYSTPVRNINTIDVEKYKVDYNDIKSVTPTLSLNKKESVQQQLSNLPVLQMLLLLASCKAAVISDEDNVTSSDIKKTFLELGEILLMESGDIEAFCNSEFESSIDTFRQLSLFSKSEYFDYESIGFRTDPMQLAEIILQLNPAFGTLTLEDIRDPKLMLTKRYSSLANIFDLKKGKKTKKKLWWSKN
ncbi:hypothetical protein BEWA_024750 [Theileria equi strain WA]|uniref:Orc1-like AAA ATPase domain-containing protein n=1 Tax=Theileria equi strain WA TaxID=1537102 RepID=L0AX75_THEEQ|nr:hypothetical protein BEWA_024750 [Theileria equi strain WA]AFZ79626.1 hypothetical protein BEWA_024750 [Theileria equi strain WA]|eukprot:XP_004829292.1 hypothetical protein BEWA_024750 [Theileria equi strain WA]